MNKAIAAIILAWHDIYQSLNTCIESARVMLDQSNRATLLPDRVREMRGELLAVQERIPALADMLEELTDEQSWPTKEEAESIVADPILDESVALSDEMIAAHGIEKPPVTGEGDYTADGSTPIVDAVSDPEAAAEAVVEGNEPTPEADAAGTP